MSLSPISPPAKIESSPQIEKLDSGLEGSKPHFLILDGLRGVAALMVIWFHVFEVFATSPLDQKFNHGYLAVDFFFILSGFVVGFAYDNRWGKMTTMDFFKRRIIRLHPMVIIGAVLGAITFYIQGCQQWNGTQVSVSVLMVSMLLGMFLIPVAPGMALDVRGNGETHPLNGPSWSLFFEYIGNIFYALILRRLSTKVLAVFVGLMGIGLAGFAIGNFSNFGHIGVGWSFGENNFIGGLLRLLFSFSAGLLLSRKFKPIKVKGAFLICSLAIIGLLSMPHVGGQNALWLNGIYDSVCVLVIFPLLVFLGASGQIKAQASKKVYEFLGKISYPVYIIHYPFMYLFYAWVWGHGVFSRGEESVNLTFSESWPGAVLVFLGSLVLAYGFLKFYDEPVRRFLSKRFLGVGK